MFKYIMILVFGLSLFLPVVVQAGGVPTVAIIQCSAEGSINVASASANDALPSPACNTGGTEDCATCIQAILDFGLDLRQIDVPTQGTSWYHFFDNDRKDFDR